MSKPRLLLLLSESENKRLLVHKLASDFEMVMLNEQLLGDRDTVAPLEPDLIICSLADLGRWRMQISQWRHEAEPLLLPVLALMPKNTVGALPADVRYQIDELVTIPIDPDELDVRIALLLRSRRLSIELAERNQKLEELNSLKTRFVSMVSHEFRNPLSVISGIAQLLQAKEQQYSTEKKQDLFQRLQKVVGKLTDLLDDLLVLSRNTSSQVTFSPQPVDIEQYCKDLVDNFQLGTLESCDIRFQTDGAIASASLDVALIDTILNNLLSNAIKYSSAESPVYLRVNQEHEQIILQVQDEGQGIPLEDQSALFDAFFRARNVGTIPGTGLGLNIVKQCVDLHHGDIRVESALGQGTTFTVRLPCAFEVGSHE